MENNELEQTKAELAALREELAASENARRSFLKEATEGIDKLEVKLAIADKRLTDQGKMLRRVLIERDAAEQRNAELVELLRDTRDLIRPSAVLSPDDESARLKARLDAALLNSPTQTHGERIPGCADAAWLLYDGNLYGQHGVLVMDSATILQKATSYAGYNPTESGASDKCLSDGGTCGLGGHCGECPHVESGASE